MATRPAWRGAGLAALVGLMAASAAVAQPAQPPLQNVRLGFAAKVITPMIANILIPERLGYYREEGLTVEFVPLGPNPVVLEQLASKRIDFGTAAPSFQIPVVAKGEALPGINFFEFAYPFKYGLAVKPDSPIRTFADIKGRNLGIGSFGLTDFPVVKAVLKAGGLDPDKDVTITAVGEGIPGGQALQRGAVDAYFHYDTGFGSIEAAGMELRYVPLPPNIPMIGGFYLQTRPEILAERRARAVGLARAVAKAEVFIRENPEAAAYVFLQMFPEVAPKGATLKQQIKAVMAPMVKRAALFVSYDKSIAKWGYIKPEEWNEEIRFLGLGDKVKDASAFFTNALIDDINDFDAEKVRKQARDFKIPGDSN
jgi:NitT/TauT family transport system substrate-binding protein